MANFAQINDWGGLHPLVVHFPVALLVVSPLFILLGIIVPKLLKPFYTCALILMLLGTAGIFLAVSTGNSAAESLPTDPAITATLALHVHFAERSQLIFSILGAVFLIYVLSPNFLPKRSGRSDRIAGALFLVIYLLNLMLIFNAAHYGGKLVHEHGIRSSLYQDPSQK